MGFWGEHDLGASEDPPNAAQQLRALLNPDTVEALAWRLPRLALLITERPAMSMFVPYPSVADAARRGALLRARHEAAALGERDETDAIIDAYRSVVRRVRRHIRPHVTASERDAVVAIALWGRADADDLRVLWGASRLTAPDGTAAPRIALEETPAWPYLEALPHLRVRDLERMVELGAHDIARRRDARNRLVNALRDSAGVALKADAARVVAISRAFRAAGADVANDGRDVLSDIALGLMATTSAPDDPAVQLLTSPWTDPQGGGAAHF